MAGTAILYLLLLLSAFYCCWQLRIRRMFPAVGLLLLAPLSIPYCTNILIGVFYIPHVAISFVMMGLFLQYQASEKRRSRTALLCAMGALSFVAGLGGVRQLFVLYMPAVLAACFLLFKAQKGNPPPVAKTGPIHACRRLVLGTLLSAAMAVLGLILNKTVLTGIYGFSNPMEETIFFTPFDLERFLAVINDMLAFFGYRTWTVGPRSLCYNALMLLLLAALLATVARTARASSADVGSGMLGAFFIASVFLFVLLYSFTDTFYYPTYQIPVMVFAFLVIGLCLERMDFGKVLQSCCAILGVCLLVLTGTLTWRIFAQDPTHSLGLREDPQQLAEIAAEMTQAGYPAGYSTFWSGGNAMTELSDGQIEMYVLNYSGISLNDVYPWLQDKAHLTQQPEGPFFLMIRTADLGIQGITFHLNENDVIYRTEDFWIFGYDSMAQYQASLLPQPKTYD